MTSLLISQFLGLGGNLPQDLSLTNMIFDVLPVALFGAITWIVMQNRDAIFWWLVDRMTVTAQFESGNEAYGELFL